MPGGAIFTPEQEARLREIVRAELIALGEAARAERQKNAAAADEWVESTPVAGRGRPR